MLCPEDLVSDASLEEYDYYDYAFDGNVSFDYAALHISYNITHEEEVYRQIHYVSNFIVLPIIFILGIIGNIVNIIIFTRSRFRHALDEIEKSAATGLVALAVSDLSFCLVGLPAAFLPAIHKTTGDAVLLVVTLYYDTFKSSILNLFAFSSTWLVVAVAMERYIAVIFPFQARWLIKVSRTVIMDIAIYALALVISIPGFTKYYIEAVYCDNGTVRHFVLFNPQFSRIQHGYLITWAIFGTFLPIAMLIIFNIRLVTKIYKSRARCSNSSDVLQYSASKITTILIAIVVLHVVLVSPSMILSFLRILPAAMSESGGHQIYYRTSAATVVANVAQAINYAVNFLLYCALSRPFRDHLTLHTCKRSPSRASTDTIHRYQLVEVHI